MGDRNREWRGVERHDSNRGSCQADQLEDLVR